MADPTLATMAQRLNAARNWQPMLQQRVRQGFQAALPTMPPDLQAFVQQAVARQNAQQALRGPQETYLPFEPGKDYGAPPAAPAPTTPAQPTQPTGPSETDRRFEAGQAYYDAYNAYLANPMNGDAERVARAAWQNALNWGVQGVPTVFPVQTQANAGQVYTAGKAWVDANNAYLANPTSQDAYRVALAAYNNAKAWNVPQLGPPPVAPAAPVGGAGQNQATLAGQNRALSGESNQIPGGYTPGLPPGVAGPRPSLSTAVADGTSSPGGGPMLSGAYNPQGAAGGMASAGLPGPTPLPMPFGTLGAQAGMLAALLGQSAGMPPMGQALPAGYAVSDPTTSSTGQWSGSAWAPGGSAGAPSAPGPNPLPLPAGFDWEGRPAGTPGPRPSKQFGQW